MLEDFHFLRPLWFLALLPLGVVVWLTLSHIKKGKAWSNVCDPHLLPFIINSVHGNIKKRFPWGGILAGILAITALAGPVWQRIPQPVFSNQSALVIVLDLSLSMEATDIKPNRITRAKHKVLDVLARRKEGQTALIVYAAEPFVVSPLTDDSNNIVALVNSLTTNLMPAQGSQAISALQNAVDLFKNSGIRRGDILLITDGWPDNSAFEPEIIKNHRLSILGVGTAQGAPIPLARAGFFTDNSGAIVIPKLHDLPLQKIVSQTNGYYSTLKTDDSDLDLILAGIKKSPLSMEISETDFSADRWHEEGPWLLLPVLIWAATLFRRQSLLLLFFLLYQPTNAHAIDWDGLWATPDQRAAAALADNKTEKAGELFTDPNWKAVAKYREGKYDAALKSLEGQTDSIANYNRGNTLARLGQLQKAIDAYKETLKQNPDHADAKHNLEVVKKALKEQSQKQQGNKNQDDKDKKKGEKQDNSQDSSQDGKEQKQGEDAKKQEGDKQQKNSSNQNESGENEKPENKNVEKTNKENQEKEKLDAKKLQEMEEKQKAEENKAEEEKNSTTPEQTAQQLKDEEEKMATEQWLRRVPDNPGGLLRRKFFNQYQNRNIRRSGIDQPW
ncbi:MAG: VWA domain-containing protein [Magnetococcales bacterium]|nr:VWA domain-containing protein [Magnetococcales bacterium]